MRDQRGFTMIEMLVSISASLVVLIGIGTLTTTVLHQQDRITRRVDASSRARPAMTRIVQDLHSACVTSHIVPIRSGSTGTSISFLSKRGSAPGLTPDLHTVSLNGGALRESVLPMTGTAPNWTPSGTPPPNPPILLSNVTAPGGVIFRYYDFVNGALNSIPLATPLSDANAARVSYVTVTFTSSPSKGISRLDAGSPLALSSGVDLRLENAGQYPNQDNLPCV